MQGTTKGGKEKTTRTKNAYQLYSDSRREKVKAENPNAGFGELTKILGTTLSYPISLLRYYIIHVFTILQDQKG
jgi:hypothetical protein